MQFKKGSLTGAHRWNALFHGRPQAGVIFFNFFLFCGILLFYGRIAVSKMSTVTQQKQTNKWNNGVMCYIHTHRDTQMFG